MASNGGDLLQAAYRLAPAQRSRFLRLRTDEFYLIDTETTPEARADGADTLHRFKISGSTRSMYTVRLRSDGTLGCTCPDMAMNCKRVNCVCKHACFVLYRVLKHHDVEFFRRGNVLEDEELARVLQTARNLRSEVDPAVMFESLSLSLSDAVAARKTNQDDTFAFCGDLPAVADDDCPVCYDRLDHDAAALLTCVACRKSLHRVCMSKWLLTCQKGQKTCVYCRSPAWNRYRS
jgi:hypothetical protein